MKKENVVVKNKCHAKLDLASSTQVVNKQQQQALKILNQVQDDKRRGFTLIELLVVVLIIGILAAVAVPQYQMAILKSHYAKIKSLANSLAQTQEVYYLTNGQYAEKIEKLDIDMPGGKLNTSTDNEYFYDWGECWVAGINSYDPRVGCQHDKAKLKYYIHLIHNSSINKGIRRCKANDSDENAIQNKLCKAETRATTGFAADNGIYWTYQ